MAEIVQQYPSDSGDAEAVKSMRLNHPDWGDVNKTTYVKGIITAFEQVQDDPIQVTPRVKVRVGDGAESGFIPIFFHPKEKYWDGPDEKATDLDEANFHKRAWMHFRGEDEVIVLLQEGTPFAVVGFADGVPRIGEDIFRLFQSIALGDGYAAPADYYFQASTQDDYADRDIGPDGLNLRLDQKAERYNGNDERLYADGTLWHWNGDAPPTYWTEVFHVEVDDVAPLGSHNYLIGPRTSYWYLVPSTASAVKKQISMWLVKIGPILYAIFGLFNASYSETYWWADPMYTAPYDDNIYKTIAHQAYLSRFAIYAGVYTKSLEGSIIGCINRFLPSQAEAISQNSDWFPVLPDAMKFQAAMTTKVNGKGDINILNWTDLSWYFRPHTKEEMVATGLWPWS